MRSDLFVLLLICFVDHRTQSQNIPFRFRIVTWNLEDAQPDCDTYKKIAFASSNKSIQSDLIVLGLQSAKRVYLGRYSFHKLLKSCFENEGYVEILADHVGSRISKATRLYLYVLKTKRIELLPWRNELTLKVQQDGLLNWFAGYKDIIAARVQIDRKSNLIFVNMHLPSADTETEKRCDLWSYFLKAYKRYSKGDDYIFAFGDQSWHTLKTNRDEMIVHEIQRKNYQFILEHDELTKARAKAKGKSSAPCMSNYVEATITFPPTYKFVPNTNEYETGKKKDEYRPSYPDRILVSQLGKDLEIDRYSSIPEIQLSDHRPVYADLILGKPVVREKLFSTTTTLKALRKQSRSSGSSAKIMIIVIVMISICACLPIYFLIKRQRANREDNGSLSSASEQSAPDTNVLET